MSVFTYKKIKKENGRTNFVKTLVLDNIPCHLASIISARGTVRDILRSETVNKLYRVKKVFLSPKFIIDVGSYVEILQDGRLYEYAYTGESYVYSTHQEIYLEDKRIS